MFIRCLLILMFIMIVQQANANMARCLEEMCGDPITEECALTCERNSEINDNIERCIEHFCGGDVFDNECVRDCEVRNDPQMDKRVESNLKDSDKQHGKEESNKRMVAENEQLQGSGLNRHDEMNTLIRDWRVKSKRF